MFTELNESTCIVSYNIEPTFTSPEMNMNAVITVCTFLSQLNVCFCFQLFPELLLLICSSIYANFVFISCYGKFCFQVIAERLSEEEIGGLKELFNMIDTDNSGTITFEELKEGLKRVGSELMESEIKSLMDAVSRSS